MMADRLSSIPAEIPSTAYAYYTLGDGARLRYAVVEPQGTPRGTVLIVQGRREFIEKKYIEAGRDFLSRGYKVILFDSRGQGLSSRFLDGDRHQYDYMTDFSVHIEDMRAFYRAIVKPNQSGRLTVLAHSMGGLITAHWLSDTPQDKSGVKAVIFTAPAFMIGVPHFSLPISRVLAKLGRSELYAAGQHDYGGNDGQFARNLLSHDRDRYGIIERYFKANPNLKVGGVTWGWLVAALTAMKQLHHPGYLERIDMPVLALFAGRDIVTPPSKTIPLAQRMPQAELVTIRGAWHDLLNEADAYRDQCWRWIDEFLKRLPF